MLNNSQKTYMLALVADLRANPTLQGRKALRTGDMFCCLGRACHLINPDKWLKTPTGKWVFDDALQTVGLEYLNGDVLPIDISAIYGFDSRQGFMMDVDSRDIRYRDSLSALNDDGLTFPQIADLIVREYSL